MASGHERHLARERALELLYEAEIKGRTPDEIVAELPAPPDPYVVTLIDAATRTRGAAEAAIAKAAPDWPLSRLAVLDRLIMVLALGELCTPTAPPDAVVLDEAVELAKTYSTDASPRFVNGVLVAVLPVLRAGDVDDDRAAPEATGP
jgi:transcription antitermination protein NusB